MSLNLVREQHFIRIVYHNYYIMMTELVSFDIQLQVRHCFQCNPPSPPTPQFLGAGMISHLTVGPQYEEDDV